MKYRISSHGFASLMNAIVIVGIGTSFGCRAPIIDPQPTPNPITNNLLTVEYPEKGIIAHRIDYAYPESQDNFDILCGEGYTDCSEEYPSNAMVSLGVIYYIGDEPPVNYDYDWNYQWQGDCEDKIVCDVFMDAPRNVTLQNDVCGDLAAARIDRICLHPGSVEVYDSAGNLIVDGYEMTIGEWDAQFFNPADSSSFTHIFLEGAFFSDSRYEYHRDPLVNHISFFLSWDDPQDLIGEQVWIPSTLVLNDLIFFGLSSNFTDMVTVRINGSQKDYKFRERIVDGRRRIESGPGNHDLTFYFEFAGEAPPYDYQPSDSVDPSTFPSDYVINYAVRNLATNEAVYYEDGIFTLVDAQGSIFKCGFNVYDWSRRSGFGYHTLRPQTGCTVFSQ